MFEDEITLQISKVVLRLFVINFTVLRCEYRALPLEMHCFLLLETAFQGEFVQVSLRLLSNSIYLLNSHPSAPALNKYLCALQVSTNENRNVVQQNDQVE